MTQDKEFIHLSDCEAISECLKFCYEQAKPDGFGYDITSQAFDAWCSGKFQEKETDKKK